MSMHGGSEPGGTAAYDRYINFHHNEKQKCAISA
jgi:hypothetical protein